VSLWAKYSDQWPVKRLEQENPPFIPLLQRGMKGGFSLDSAPGIPYTPGEAGI